jgi:ParB-like chromosome segregation protein Spo0J
VSSSVAIHDGWQAKSWGCEKCQLHVADNLTPAQVRAYRLLDNRSHEETSWDSDLLGLELLELQGLGVDLDLTGFDDRKSTLAVPTKALGG